MDRKIVTTKITIDASKSYKEEILNKNMSGQKNKLEKIKKVISDESKLHLGYRVFYYYTSEGEMNASGHSVITLANALEMVTGHRYVGLRICVSRTGELYVPEPSLCLLKNTAAFSGIAVAKYHGNKNNATFTGEINPKNQLDIDTTGWVKIPFDWGDTYQPDPKIHSSDGKIYYGSGWIRTAVTNHLAEISKVGCFTGKHKKLTLGIFACYYAGKKVKYISEYKKEKIDRVKIKNTWTNIYKEVPIYKSKMILDKTKIDKAYEYLGETIIETAGPEIAIEGLDLQIVKNKTDITYRVPMPIGLHKSTIDVWVDLLSQITETTGANFTGWCEKFAKYIQMKHDNTPKVSWRSTDLEEINTSQYTI